MYEKSRPNLFNKMNNIVFKEEQIQKNQTFSNKTQKNSNNISEEIKNKSLQNKVIRRINSETRETLQNFNIDKKKSSKSLKNYGLLPLENLKNDDFSFVDDDEENLCNFFGDNSKIEKIGENSINDKNEVEQKNSDIFTSTFFSDDENNEKKIIDFSEDEEGKGIKNDLKLINKNTNYVKNNKQNENKRQITNEINTINEHEQNTNNENTNGDISQSYLAKGWEDFSFLDQTYCTNDIQTKKQLIKNFNNFNQNQWRLNPNFQINFNIMNYFNNFKNCGNCNFFMNNIKQNNPMKRKKIHQNKYNNQFNFLQNPYFQNSNNKNNEFKNFNFPQSQNFKNQNNPSKKYEKKDINKNNLIDINNIKSGLEIRTTIRMMNIPEHCSASQLSLAIDKNLNIDPKKENRTYNYIYVPRTMKNGHRNTGFAFINFVHPKHIIKFYEYYQNRNLKTDKSSKICFLTFANKQIKADNLGNDINPNGNYIIFNDTKNHFLLFDK